MSIKKRQAASKKLVESKVNLHVVLRDGAWQVIAEGRKTATSMHRTQKTAAEKARSIARKNSGDVVIHGRNGRVRKRDSYPRGPLPPRQIRKVLRPSMPPQNATRYAISKAVSNAIRESKAVSG